MSDDLETMLIDQLDQVGTRIQPPPAPVALVTSAGERARRRRHLRVGVLTGVCLVAAAVVVGVLTHLPGSLTNSPIGPPTPSPSRVTGGLQVQAHTRLPTVVTPPLGPLPYAVADNSFYVSVTRGGPGESGFRLVKLRDPSLRQVASVPSGLGTVVSELTPPVGGGVWTVDAPDTDPLGPGKVGTLTQRDPNTLAVVRRVRLAFGPALALISGHTLVYAGGTGLAAIDLPAATPRWRTVVGTSTSTSTSTGNVAALTISPDQHLLYDVVDTRAGAVLQARDLGTGRLIATRAGLTDATVTPTSGGVWFSTWRATGTSTVRLYRGPHLTPATRVAASDIGTNILPVVSGHALWLVPTVQPGPMVCADPTTGTIVTTIRNPDRWPTNQLPNGQLLGFTIGGIATFATSGHC